MKEKINNFLTLSEPFYEIMQYVFIGAYLVFIILPFPIILGFYITLPVMNLLLYIFYKDYMENKKRGWVVFLIQITVFLISVPLYLIKLIQEHIDSTIPFPIKAIFSVCVFIFVFALLLSDSKNKHEKFDSIKVKEKLEGVLGGGSDEGHDIKICKDKENGLDVFIKEHDRFVHLLVLGPTGCGKTSQILIPMLEQDIRKGHGVIVLDPKSDLAVKAYAMSIYYKKPGLYFNPVEPDCPFFNPLDGKESVVIENITTIFEMLTEDSMTYYKDLANNLLRNALRLLKRMEAAYLDYNTGISSRPATLLALSDLLQNTNNRGRDMVTAFKKIPGVTPQEKKENEDIVGYFIDKYYADRSIDYQNTGGVRTQVSNLINNEHLRRVLNPENGKSDINFSEIIENEGRIFITTAQGELKNLNKYLGFFLMFSIQAAILDRKGNEHTRKPCYWYLDEFQTYANTGFSTILQQGRSYRVSAILATQSRNGIKLGLGNSGDAFLSIINTNARSQVLFPGLDPEDAKYYSEAFGEHTVKEVQTGRTRQVFELGHGLQQTSFPTEQERETEKDKARFSATDLTELEFSEITYRRILDNNVKVASVGIASFIDRELDNELDQIVKKHTSEQEAKREANERALYEIRKKKYTEFQAGAKSGFDSMGANNNSNGSPSVEGDPIPGEKEELGSMAGGVPFG